MKRCELCEECCPDSVQQCECGSYVFTPDETENLVQQILSNPDATKQPMDFALARLWAGHSLQQVEQDLLTLGQSAEETASILRQASAEMRREAARKEGREEMLVGALWLLGGFAVTIMTYLAAAQGGPYVIAWGAVGYGMLRFTRGLRKSQIK